MGGHMDWTTFGLLCYPISFSIISFKTFFSFYCMIFKWHPFFIIYFHIVFVWAHLLEKVNSFIVLLTKAVYSSLKRCFTIVTCDRRVPILIKQGQGRAYKTSCGNNVTITLRYNQKIGIEIQKLSPIRHGQASIRGLSQPGEKNSYSTLRLLFLNLNN